MKNLLFVLSMLLFAGWMSCSPQKASDDAAAATATDTTKAMAPVEFADAKYSAIGKKMLTSLASGNVDAYMESFADDAKYRWNSGDSLTGKAAIKDFWANRWATALDSLSFTNEIYLPVKVNKTQATEQAGTWLLAWYQVYAKYKTGKSMTQWMHFDMHFDATDKINEVIQYRDNAPILEAMKK